MGLGSTYGDAVPRLHAKEDTAQALVPCAMSSLRGASGVVGCDRVVCPLVLHATTIAHLDVRLCTDLFFLLCAVLLCGAVCSVCAAPVPLSCGVPCALPSLPVVWLRGAVAGVWVRPDPALPAPAGVCYGVPCTPCVLPALFSWDNTCPIYGGVLYAGLVHSLYTCPFFRLAIYDPFCTHSKSRPLDSECGFPKVGLNFRCSVFLFAEFSPVKFPA